MLPAYCDKLPATKSSRHNRVAYTPCESHPGAGVLTIATDRGATEYALVETETDWAGRAFALVKIGADGEEPEQYSCFVGSAVDSRCECKGWLRWQTPCKHLLALRQLVESGEV